MQAVGKTGGQYIAYSDRFSYSGMTGSFPADAKIQAGLKSISGTTGPDNVDNTVATGGNTAAPAGDNAYEVEYTMQTGLTRYAPMQPVPLTSITAGKPTKPLYPTSSVQIAKTILPIPKVQTTITQSQTYSVSSRENTVRTSHWQPHSAEDKHTNPTLRLLRPLTRQTTWPSSLTAGRTRRPLLLPRSPSIRENTRPQPPRPQSLSRSQNTGSDIRLKSLLQFSTA